MTTSPVHGDSYWQVAVRPREAAFDVRGRSVLTDVHQLGYRQVQSVSFTQFYFLRGTLSDEAVRSIAARLLADSVTEEFRFSAGLTKRDYAHPAVEVHLQPGVMNPPAESIRQAANRLLHKIGFDQQEVREVQTARGFELAGSITGSELDSLTSRLLANSCIERWYVFSPERTDALPDHFAIPPNREFQLRRVSLVALDDDGLAKLSRQGHLFLSLEEMRAIRDHFAGLKRDPTDLELETLAQTWSEHCVHKTLKSTVVYRGADFGRDGQVEVRFENLLKDTIAAATHKLAKPWCLSVFVDNAGVIEFDEDFGIAFKVETHNHPSAIEPYGGASTGVGGCIRDIMGCGLGAKPIASTDVFCLAPPNYDGAKLPKDVLHPRRTLSGVVGGVRDYGNRMGIPTVNGAIYFDDRYLANPLVFCGCVGLIPRNRLEKGARAGDLIVVAGGRTGRDGIHGATFSSAELTDTHADEFAHAVQIGNAIEQKKVLDVLLRARDHASGCLYSSVTDCGAGGLSSAVGEMGAELGAVVDLEKVPLKYAGLRYDEIWISEAQERMVFAIPPNNWPAFSAVFSAEEVEATVIGSFTGDRVLHIRYRGETVGRLDMTFVHDGRPPSLRTATWNKAPTQRQPIEKPVGGSVLAALQHRAPAEINAKSLLDALGQLNVASKEWVIRQYDHEVQGRSVIKPLCGPYAGPSDAAVLRPRLDSYRGVAIGCGLCPHVSEIDPYFMAMAAVDEALRNVICVGGDPERTSILDNFCWPKVDTEESMGALVRTCRGAHDAAVAFGVPFISGKDSLNNQFSMSAEESRRTGLPQQLAIPYTLLVSALSIVPDVRQCKIMSLMHPGHRIVLASAPIETVGLAGAKMLHDRVAKLIGEGKVHAAHDVSDGGWAVAMAEMCIASGIGVDIDIGAMGLTLDPFAEPTTTYLLEMSAVDARSSGLPTIAAVTESPSFRVHRGGERLFEVSVADLNHAWKSPLSHGGGGAHG